MNYSFKEISDRSVWDQFIYQNAPYSLFQSWLWGEVLAHEHTTLMRFGVFKHDTELVAVFQTVLIRAKRGHFVHVRHGPVCNTQDKQLWKEVTDFLIDYTKKHRALFFRVSPLIDSDYHTVLVELGYQSAAIHAMDAEYCWVLPLDSTEEEILKNMRKTTRYEIKRAEKMGVEVIKTTNPKDYVHFDALYKATAERQGFVPHTGIEEEFELFSQENQAMLFLGKYQGDVIAAAIILFTGTQGIYHHGASHSNKIPASYLIQWEAIKEAKKRGMRQYNFWGIAPDGIEHHPWNGITLFKKGFGGHELQYLHAHDFPVSPFYLLPKSVETIRRMRKGY